MATPIDRYIYNYEKRVEMRKHPMFIKLSEEIDKGNYLTTEKIGCIPFIIREALEKIQKNDKNAKMSIYQWEEYYLDSGKRRSDNIQKSRGRVTYQHNEYYGRTLDDILAITKEFYLAFKDKYSFNQQAALNTIYIKVIDESYDEYKRLINTKETLERVNPNFIFKISDALTKKEQAVDMFVHQRSMGDIVGAIQILPESYYGFELDSEREKEFELFKQQHEIFELTYDIVPELVYAAVTGQIKGSIPKY